MLFLTACSNSPTTAPGTSTAPATTSPVAAEPKILKIGVVNDLTGFLAPFEINEQRNIEALAQLLNDKGGITIQGQKYTIQLATEDDQTTPEGALAAANKLVFDEKVKYAIGPVAFLGTATTPIFEQNGVLHILTYSTNMPAEISSTTPYAFTANSATAGLGTAMIKTLKKQYPDVKTIAIIEPDDGQSQYVLPLLKPTLDSLGMTVVNDGNAILVPNSMMDFTPIADKVNSLHPDSVMYLNGPLQAYGSVVKHLRLVGNNAPFIASTFQTADTLLSIIGPDAATDIITMPSFSPDDPQNPAILNELIARLPKIADIQTSIDWANGLYLITQMMQKADSIEVDKVIAAWESATSVDTLYGSCTLGGEQTYGLKNHVLINSWPAQAIQNGKVVKLGWTETGPIP
jgi:branched-chain amino acid transport system substrate-binding protein